MARRVVVTGLGLISPVGNTVQDAWTQIINAKSGIDTIDDWKNTKWAGETLGVTIGGAVKNFDPEAYVEPKKDIRRMDRLLQFSIAAGKQAWENAGLPAKLDDADAPRAGAIVGVGLIGLNSLIDYYEVLKAKGPKRVTPFLIPSIISNLAPGYLAIRYNLKNANWSCVSACASGTHAIGEAFMHVQSGRADLMMAGGAESSMHAIAIAGFDSMHALCRSRNDSPQTASRPFDKSRDGFVMGEGAGIIVLEEYERAKARGANILAEIVGYGSTNDAFHITAPAENGEGAQRAMREALNMAKASPTDVGYINAHGTSTPFNDKSETDAIKGVFGDHAYKLMVSSTKSMTGHLLGAAGGVEAVFSVLSLTQKVIPPTINYETPDPECDLDYVPNQAREAKVDYVMSNSFGFGGANAVLLFKRS